MHEAVELVKALAWPTVVLFFLVRYHRPIRKILDALPAVIHRVRSAHGLGVEIELDKIADELPIAERQALSLSLEPTEAPTSSRKEGE